MYVALKHIGGKYTPGEILPDNLPTDEVKWLLEAGAIREVAPALSMPETPIKPEALEKTEPNSEESASETAPEGETEAGEEMVEEVAEEAEALEIDITEGLVPGDTEAAKPATKKTSRRGKTK